MLGQFNQNFKYKRFKKEKSCLYFHECFAWSLWSARGFLCPLRVMSSEQAMNTMQWITYWNINGSRLIHKEINVCILLLNKKDFLYQTRSQIHNSGKQIELSGKWTRLNLGSLWSLADPASEEWFSLFIQIHFPSLYFHPFSWYLFTGVFPFPSLYFSKLMQFSKFMKRLLQSHLKQFRMLSSRPTAPYLPLHQ